MIKSRRRFIRNSALGLPVLSLKAKRFRPPILPVVVSTWDSGTIANETAWSALTAGEKALDAVEKAGIAIEDVVSCCVGLGGNPDRDGFVTLDACIMDEEANIGSVAFLERIKHPVSVARKVMEETPHVMLVGIGAQNFAIQQGFPLESGELSPAARKTYEKWLEKSEYNPRINIERTQGKSKGGPFAPSRLPDGSFNHDTMGTIALDQSGNLSGMCTTSGMGFKMRGRVGDSPIIGAGLFVDNEVGAVVCTGQGEEVIRVAGAHLVVEFMRDGLSPKEACMKGIERIVTRDTERAKDFQVGFIALSPTGEYGAFAVQKGFNYTISEPDQQGIVLDSESYFD